MPGENPGAYDEARKRIRENKESEAVVVETKKEDFEKGKEKLRSRKKLDVFELKHRIETGQSLDALKSDIRAALDAGEISADTYREALDRIDIGERQSSRPGVQPDRVLRDDDYPLSSVSLTQYFESQKLGDNLLIDIAGFAYGVAQGSVFLLWLAGRIVLDTLLLPIDVYKMMQK